MLKKALMRKDKRLRIRKLRTKFYNGTLNPEEKEELFYHYRHLCPRGKVNEFIIRNFLSLTNPKMGLGLFRK